VGFILTNDCIAISLQKSLAEINELYGKKCFAIYSIGKSISDELYNFFIETDVGNYNFYIDEGVLFFTNQDRDPEDDLSEEDEYIDITSIHHLNNSILSKLVFMDNKFKIVFSMGESFWFETDPNGVTKVSYYTTNQ